MDREAIMREIAAITEAAIEEEAQLLMEKNKSLTLGEARRLVNHYQVDYKGEKWLRYIRLSLQLHKLDA